VEHWSRNVDDLSSSPGAQAAVNRHPERRHGLDMALAEYSRLLETYPSLGYEVVILPKVGVSERADFILNTLEA
jgi:predicted ATPase